MFLRFTAIAAGAVLLSVLATLPAGRASAHEHRTVAANYEFFVGFLNEPALAFEPNGLFLSVEFFEGGVPEEEEHAEGAEEEEVGGVPVEGLEETLRAEVIVGGAAQTRALELEPAFGEPGVYHGNFIPTIAGDYTFRISGDLEGQAIDETFESGPDTFSPVEDVAELQFPNKAPSNADLQASLDALSAQVAGSGGGDDDSGTALLIAIIALVAGGLGVGTGALALISMRRS